MLATLFVNHSVLLQTLAYLLQVCGGGRAFIGGASVTSVHLTRCLLPYYETRIQHASHRHTQTERCPKRAQSLLTGFNI